MPLLKELSKILHLLFGFFFPLYVPIWFPIISSSISLQQVVLSKNDITIQNWKWEHNQCLFYKTLMQKSSLNQHQVETTSYALKISVRSTQLAGLMSHDRNLKFWGPNCWCWESRNGPTWSPSHIGKGYWGQILPLFRLLELQNLACRKCQFWGICKLWGTKALFHSRPQLIHKGLYPGILQDFRCLKWKDQQ